MMCKCGATMANGQHEVKTLKKAVEWCYVAIDSDLPLLIDQNKCGSCGMINYKVINKGGLVIKYFN